VTKIIHRKGRKERKVFRIYNKDIIFFTVKPKLKIKPNVEV